MEGTVPAAGRVKIAPPPPPPQARSPSGVQARTEGRPSAHPQGSARLAEIAVTADLALIVAQDPTADREMIADPAWIVALDRTADHAKIADLAKTVDLVKIGPPAPL